MDQKHDGNTPHKSSLGESDGWQMVGYVMARRINPSDVALAKTSIT